MVGCIKNLIDERGMKNLSKARLHASPVRTSREPEWTHRAAASYLCAMRTIVFILLTTAVAFRLAGQSGPSVSPKEVTMQVGQTAALAGSDHPGGLTCGFPYHFNFISDMPAVAIVHGFASGSSVCYPDQVPDNGVVSVTAVAPGIAHVRVEGCCGDLSTITVLPQLHPVALYAQPARVLLGQPVVVTALLTGSDQTPVFVWYRGRIGDYSLRLQQSSDPHLTFLGSDPGVSYIWVQAFEGSVTSYAEIGIEFFIQPRKRAAH